MMTTNWQRFRNYLFQFEDPDFQLDISRMNFTESFLEEMEPRMQEVYGRIWNLERGVLANPDEQRMVGHYWLRAPELAPTLELGEEIRRAQAQVENFARQIHMGTLLGQTGQPFKQILVIGIGGSSLGSSFVSDALWKKGAPCALYFIDNTDPDGMDRIMERLPEGLEATLTVVISKSGGTIETRNGLEEVRRRYAGQGLDFRLQAVCITQPGSSLDRMSRADGWLAAFPLWDWVGGRTSVLSPVGLLPLTLQGIDVQALLVGAGKCDVLTRCRETRKNPAAMLALMWYAQTGGLGGQQMVILPYKDRLELLGKYLQQLIMESLGKERDLDGNIVHQGLAVLGNKGSTDQHSYLQQLLDGPANFFVVFIEVLKDREGPSPKIAEESSSGDYLQAFLLGTRKALTQKGRNSLTLTIPEINPTTIGALIALFERAVGIYALLVNINAYHQPAVELGKKSAGEVISLKNQALAVLRSERGQDCSLENLARKIEAGDKESNKPVDREVLYKIMQHLSANPCQGTRIVQKRVVSPRDDLDVLYSYEYPTSSF